MKLLRLKKPVLNPGRGGGHLLRSEAGTGLMPRTALVSQIWSELGHTALFGLWNLSIRRL